VVTFYPGASPDVMASSVTAPLERQLGQMPGLSHMTSTSSSGSSLITLQFSLDLSLDVAEQEVQAAINAAGTFLPRDLPNPPIYSKVNPADAPILTFALTSKTLPLPAIEDLAETPARPEDRRGARRRPGQHQRRPASGGAHPRQSGRARRLRPDARAAARRNRRSQRQSGQGQLRRPARSFTIGANDQLLTSAEYKPLVIAYRNDAPVRVQDVAEVIDDAENVKQAAWMADAKQDAPAVVLNVQRQPGANVIGVVDQIQKLLPQLAHALPSSIEITQLTDRTTTIRSSVEDVQFELVLSVVLVVGVIFLFLRSPRRHADPGDRGTLCRWSAPSG